MTLCILVFMVHTQITFTSEELTFVVVVVLVIQGGRLGAQQGLY
jgi:hypothetical protein